MTPDSLSERLESAIGNFEPGARLIETRSLHGGISATMTAFEIELPGGERKTLIARQPGQYRFNENSDAAAFEAGVLRVLKQAGLPVQTTYYVEPKTEEVPRPFFVIEYIEGRPELNPDDRSAFVRRYAQQMAAIHAVALDKLQSLKKQERNYSEPWLPAPDEALRESEIRKALGSAKVKHPNPPVLRHGDLWPGNVLWRDGEIVGVIDWEESLIGEPLADVAIARLDLWWVVGRKAAMEFTEHWHTITQTDMTDLPFWDLCASLRPMGYLKEWATSYEGLGRPDITFETMKRDHREFVEQALRLVSR